MRHGLTEAEAEAEAVVEFDRKQGLWNVDAVEAILLSLESRSLTQTHTDKELAIIY